MAQLLELTVDGVPLSAAVAPDRTLLRALRDDLGLTATKEGCDDSECGACMVLIDGRPVNSCSYLALQAAGRAVTTVAGLVGPDGGLHPLQVAFLEGGGIQCGFCTPGMLISAAALLAHDPAPTDEAIRDGLAGNLCRCTGYQPIVRAVQRAAAEMSAMAAPTAGADVSSAAALTAGAGVSGSAAVPGALSAATGDKDQPPGTVAD